MMNTFKKSITIQTSVTMFVLVEIFYLMLIGLWFLLFLTIDEINPLLDSMVNTNLFSVPVKTLLFLCGLCLIFLNSGGTYYIFHRLIKQTRINRMYQEFIISITHDLKTPIASIQLIGETLSNRDLTDNDYYDFLNRLENDTTRLNQLIKSILEISKINKRSDMFSFVVLDADLYVRTAIRVLQSQFNLDNGSITVFGFSKCQIRIDPSAFTSVLSNLIDNSIKYSPSPVRIKIYLGYKKKNKFILIYSDEGRGISRKYRNLVFKKFVQLRSNPNSSLKGLGLGLNWCREILRIHKGRIQVKQKKISKGSLFYIEMPGEKFNNE